MPSVKVIALVSSAGGLAATQEVLRGLPPDLPAAFVVLQHIAPDHESLLPQILQRTAAMPVRRAADGAVLLPGTVWVAPSGYHTLITPERRLSLVISGPYPPPRPSADLLLSTLAMAAGPEAVAVVMTGGGNDGATGATVVHKHGGVVMATDSETSLHFSMPAATIKRDSITNAVLPVPDVAQALVQLLLTPALDDRTPPDALQET